MRLLSKDYKGLNNMENIYPSNLEQVLFKDLNREVLYKLFINSNAQSMDVEEIGMIDEGVQSSPKERGKT